jgi:hypothetical protein
MNKIKTYIKKILQKLDIKFRLIKSLDIAYVTILFFIFSFYSASVSDGIFYRIFGKNDDNNNYLILLMQISIQFGIIGVMSYIIRNIVQLIPYPFNHYYHYDRKRLNELIKGAFITTFLFLFSPHLQKKVVNLRNYASQHLQQISLIRGKIIEKKIKKIQEEEQEQQEKQQEQQQEKQQEK